MRLVIEPVIKCHRKKGPWKRLGWAYSVLVPVSMTIKTNGPVNIGNKVRSRYSGEVEITASADLEISGDLAATSLDALESLRKAMVKAGFRSKIVPR